MTPTVPRTLGEQIYQLLVTKGVTTIDHALRVVALHAHRTRLTREQLADLIARFEAHSWDLATTAAAERLLQDRGETPDAALLAYEVGALYGRNRLHGAPPWPPDAGAGEDAARAEVAEAALGETPGPGRDGEDQAEPDPWDERPAYAMVDLHGRFRAAWSPAQGRVFLRGFLRGTAHATPTLSCHMTTAQARLLGRELIAAADEGDAAGAER